MWESAAGKAVAGGRPSWRELAEGGHSEPDAPEPNCWTSTMGRECAGTQRHGYAVHKFELQPRCGCRPGMLHPWAPPAALSACSPVAALVAVVLALLRHSSLYAAVATLTALLGLVWLFGAGQ